MKRLTSLLSLYFVILLVGCIPERYTQTTETIKSVRAKIYSYENYGSVFTRDQLGISIQPDTVIYNVKTAYRSYSSSSAYADEPAWSTKYANYIDSVAVYTVFDYDANHLANSLVNDILTNGYYINDSSVFNGLVGQYYASNIDLKLLTALSESDSVQFRVEGKLSDGVKFTTKTQLVVFN